MEAKEIYVLDIIKSGKYSLFMKYIIFFSLCLFAKVSTATIASLLPNNGLVQLENNSSVFITAKYVGWESDWKWDGPIVKRTGNDAEINRFILDFKKQEVRSKLEVDTNGSEIKYTFYHEFNKSLPRTIGGGIEFNLDLSNQVSNHSTKEPVLLPGDTGWSWEFQKGKTIEVLLKSGFADVYFERGNKSKIRVMFFRENITKGNSETVILVKLPENTTFRHNEKINNIKEHTLWHDDVLISSKAFVDLSYLNHKPAGKHGFVKAIGDSFLFDDGTPVVFFGTNIQAHSLFVQNKQLIQQQAKKLASLGFNLVRLHHHDSLWVQPSLINAGPTTQNINPTALDSYFWWVKCLRDEGIYIWVDLQVQRPWRRDDQIPGWVTDMAPKAKNGMSLGKGFVYLNKRMQDLTKKFNKEFLSTVNPYTKLALIEDPAVMGVLITNENDVTFHFGNNFLRDKNHPYHQRLFDEKVDSFASKYELPANKLRETWKPGISKYLLNDIEASFNREMISHLRKLGLKVPVSTTNLWGGESLFSLPALTTGDMVDAHGYGGDSQFNKTELQHNPGHVPSFLHWIGQGQVLGKPFTVTEYNVRDRADLNNSYIPTITVASMAAFQGWDAIMLYGYSQDGFRESTASPWSSYRHPAIMGVVPAMALLYREQHVAPAQKTVILAPASDTLFMKNLSPKTSAAIRTTLEQHRMVIAMPKTKILPWLIPSKIDKGANTLNDLNKNMLPENQDYIISDTGEVKRDWKKGVMTINTPKSQLAIGKLGGNEIGLNDVKIFSETPEAAIIMTSMDKQPLRNSKKILISAVAKVKKIKNKWKTRYVSEPVMADITFSSNESGLKLVTLLPDGSKGKALPLTLKSSGEYKFSLSEKDATHWYLITK